jgi:hypothetical protein
MGGGDKMEEQLIELAKQYVNMEIGPDSEIIGDKLFTLAAKVTPCTAAGKSIVAYVKAEKSTDFSMAAGDEFETMVAAVNAV